VAIESDGKLIVVGLADAGDYGAYYVSRFLGDGTIDPTYGDNGTTALPLMDIGGFNRKGLTIQPDDKALVAAEVNSGPSTSSDVAIVRLFGDVGCSNGSLDAGEECDAGALNGQPGSCCSAACELLTGNPCMIAGTCDAGICAINLTDIRKVTLRGTSDLSIPNGAISLTGRLMMSSAGDSFTPGSGIGIRVRDSSSLDYSAAFGSSECQSAVSGAVACRSADRQLRAKFAPKRDTSGEFAFRLRFHSLDIGGPFQASVFLSIFDDGVERIGTCPSDFCKTSASKMTCHRPLHG